MIAVGDEVTLEREYDNIVDNQKSAMINRWERLQNIFMVVDLTISIATQLSQN